MVVTVTDGELALRQETSSMNLVFAYLWGSFEEPNLAWRILL